MTCKKSYKKLSLQCITNIAQSIYKTYPSLVCMFVWGHQACFGSVLCSLGVGYWIWITYNPTFLAQRPENNPNWSRLHLSCRQIKIFYATQTV